MQRRCPWNRRISPVSATRIMLAWGATRTPMRRSHWLDDHSDTGWLDVAVDVAISAPMEPNEFAVPEDIRQVAKVIKDLTGLVQALQSALPPSKPWQRQLRIQLAEVDRQLQVVRMTIAMERCGQEFAAAADQLVLALRSANQYGASGRADAATRAAVQLALRMAMEIDSPADRHRTDIAGASGQ